MLEGKNNKFSLPCKTVSLFQPSNMAAVKTLHRAFSCDVIAAMQKQYISLPWEIRSIFMQSCFSPPTWPPWKPHDKNCIEMHCGSYSQMTSSCRCPVRVEKCSSEPVRRLNQDLRTLGLWIVGFSTLLAFTKWNFLGRVLLGLFHRFLFRNKNNRISCFLSLEVAPRSQQVPRRLLVGKFDLRWFCFVLLCVWSIYLPFPPYPPTSEF